MRAWCVIACSHAPLYAVVRLALHDADLSALRSVFAQNRYGAECALRTALSMCASRYEELVCWQRAEELKNAVYELIEHSKAAGAVSRCVWRGPFRAALAGLKAPRYINMENALGV